MHAIVSGRVQGVGYRYAVLKLSSQFNVAGFVRNLEDGRVEVEAEGDSGALDSFVSSLKIDDGWIQVRDVKFERVPSLKGYTGFHVLR